MEEHVPKTRSNGRKSSRPNSKKSTPGKLSSPSSNLTMDSAKKNIEKEFTQKSKSSRENTPQKSRASKRLKAVVDDEDETIEVKRTKSKLGFNPRPKP